MQQQPVLPGDTLGKFLDRHGMSRDRFFEINPQTTRRAFFTEEGVRTLEAQVGETFVVEAEDRDPPPSIVEVHAEQTECKPSGGFSFLSFLVGTAVGAVAAVFVAKETFAKGSSVTRLLQQWKSEGFGLPHESFHEVIRNPRTGALLQVDGYKVESQLGPIFFYETGDNYDDSDPAVFRAANIVTGRRLSKTYPNLEEAEDDIDYIIEQLG